MVKSLQEQLMGSGLVDKKKAKAINQEKRKQQKQRPKGKVVEDETKIELERQRLEKVEKDRLLNLKKLEQLEKRAILAQIKQLIEVNAVAREQGESPFQFTDNKKIKRIYVGPHQYEHLSKGVLAIASLNEDYILIPKGVAKKIMERDDKFICYLYEQEHNETNAIEDDPYKGFEIPDDLMW